MAAQSREEDVQPSICTSLPVSPPVKLDVNVLHHLRLSSLTSIYQQSEILAYLLLSLIVMTASMNNKSQTAMTRSFFSSSLTRVSPRSSQSRISRYCQSATCARRFAIGWHGLFCTAGRWDRRGIPRMTLSAGEEVQLRITTSPNMHTERYEEGWKAMISMSTKTMIKTICFFHVNEWKSSRVVNNVRSWRSSPYHWNSDLYAEPSRSECI